MPLEVIKMSKVKFSDVVVRANTKEDRYNTALEFYVGGEHIDTDEVVIEKRGLIAGSTIGPMFYFGFKAGQVLFVSRNPHLRKAGMVTFDGICSEKTFVLETKDESVLLQRYLPFILQSDHFWSYCEAHKSGSVNFFINWSTLAEYEFELPGVQKQQELADVLWAMTDARMAYRKLLQSTDDVVKMLFAETFYDKGFPEKSIGDVVDKRIRRVSKVFEKDDLIQYLDISSIDNASKTVKSTTPYVLKDAPSRAQYVLRKGDILYSTVRPNLQNIAINPFDDDNIVGSTGFCIIRSKDVTTEYLWGVVTSDDFTDAMITQASGANYPAVNDKVVFAYKIPIPPVDVQQEFEKVVRMAAESKGKIQEELIHLTSAYRSFLTENFA